MYKLTETRLTKIRPILDRYRSELYAVGETNPAALDGELRQALGVEADSITGLFQEVYSQLPRYKYVAAYQMQHGETPAPQQEYFPMLRELYKSPRDKQADLATIGAAFWDKFKSKKAMALRREIDELRHSPDKSQRLETMRGELRELTGELY